MRHLEYARAVSLLSLCLLAAGCGYRAQLFPSYIPEVSDSTAYSGVRPEYQELAALMEKDTGMEPTEGNTIALLPDGLQKWEILNEDLKGAGESIYIDHYRFCTDSCGTIVAGILKEKAEEGADVRVIIDKGAIDRKQRTQQLKLNDYGVRLSFFYKPVFLLDHVWLPKGMNRDHRKILLVDGRTGYLGGRNIQDSYFLEWRDADARITGPAAADLTRVVGLSQEVAAPEWGALHAAADLEESARRDSIPGLDQIYGATVQIVHDSPTDRVLPIRNCFEWAIGHAREYFWYYNPYTPPPASTIRALTDAAARGVDVRWIAPAVNDVSLEKYMGESMYRKLLKSGVRIFEWQENILHVKQFMTDGYLTAIGSANMDNLSFFLNYEVMALIYSEETTRSATRAYLSDIDGHCREITLDEVRRWSVFRRLRNWLVRSLGGHLG